MSPRLASPKTSRPQLDNEAVLKAVLGCLPGDRESYTLHEPFFGGNEWDYVKECLDTGWVSSVGGFVDRFEAKLAAVTGVRRAFAVMNGTAALHLSLKMSGVEAGDEVIVPALTFVATANAVAYCGAVPHFADSSQETLGLDPEALERGLKKVTRAGKSGCVNRRTGRPIRAVVAVHAFGIPVDLDPLADVCRRYKLVLIEDAAEALGSLYKGKHTGHWGKLSVLSFNGNKIITTGGGGAILTNDEKLGQAAKHIATTAKIPHAWAFNHDEIGYNYRMPNLNAALGLAQLERLPEFLERKRALAESYARAFRDVPGVRFVKEPVFARSNYWLNCLLLDARHKGRRDGFLAFLNERGVKARPAWTLMHRLPMYKSAPRMDLGTAEDIEARLINIPSSAFLARGKGN